jgi:hypothetical protein
VCVLCISISVLLPRLALVTGQSPLRTCHQSVFPLGSVLGEAQEPALMPGRKTLEALGQTPWRVLASGEYGLADFLGLVRDTSGTFC